MGKYHLFVVVQRSDVDERVDLSLRQTASECDKALLQQLQGDGAAFTSLKAG